MRIGGLISFSSGIVGGGGTGGGGGGGVGD